MSATPAQCEEDEHKARKSPVTVTSRSAVRSRSPVARPASGCFLRHEPGPNFARLFYGTLNSANRYAILYRIQDAKRPETRAARIAKFAEMLDRGEKIYP